MIFYLGLLVIYWFYRQTNIKVLTPCATTNPQNNFSRGHSLSIVTFNIQKFPWKLKSLSPLVDLLGNYDVILLQECFDELNESLSTLFPTHNIARGKLSGFKLLNSGLVVLAKIPIEHVNFYPFANSNILTSDCLCEKGVLACKIQWKNKLITIYNTHLQSAHNCPYDPIALKQFDELLRFVAKSGPNPENFIIGGDFNIDCQKIKSQYNLHNKLYNPTEPTIYINYNTSDSIPFAKPNYVGIVYDYFISDFELTQAKVIKTKYSDHLPVHSLIF